MAIRKRIYKEGALVRVVEIFRDARGDPRYRERDGTDAVLEDRPATPEEVQRLLSDERQARMDTIRERAEGALTGLRTIRDSSGDLTLTQLSNAVRLMARALIVLVRLALRRFGGTD